MIRIDSMKGREVAVFGLARSGLAAVRTLEASGARVLAGDDDATRLAAVGDAAADLGSVDFAGVQDLVLSPGVPFSHPVATRARDAGVALIGDIELFARARATLPEHRVCAVTGTNGKSTTAALVHHLLRACGTDSLFAGNIGTAVLDVDPLPAGGVYVFELSSFQLDLTQSLKSDVAVLLNISPDHLDRHGDMDRYVAAKARLFQMQAADQVAVIGVDDAHSRAIASSLPQRVVPISTEGAVPGGCYVLDGILFDALGDDAEAQVCNLSGVATLRGRHNWQNAAAAYAACRLLGVESEALAAAMSGFPGLPHRLEIVGHKGKLVFINDSKATNPGAAQSALAAIDGDIYWIAGGRMKDKDLTPLDGVLPRITRAFLVGEAADELAAYLGERVPHEQAGTIAAALDAAIAAAGDGAGTVLLSPACASFDQFPDFEVRGETFRKLVAECTAEGDGA